MALTLSFTPPAFAPGAPEAYDLARAQVLLFWERATHDSRISESFRSICQLNLEKVLALGSGPRLLV